MKKLVVILIMSIAVSLGAFAQGNLENNPRVKKMRKEFYQKELQFTSAEADAFWPLFEQYQRESRKLRRQYKMDTKVELLSDEEAEQQIKRQLEHDQKKTELKKKYFNEFSTAIPTRKVALIEATERKFKKSVLKKIRQNRQRRGN